ncbi:hypothetical protein [Yersinia sp. 22-579]|uniref:hypothetical protein n=1 Tax=Yersinia sp. 22-579 TaxID=3057580 RepID=UPI00263BABC2|nr:hypothetical protein [Yersinia sp. 22-579]EKN5950108.1 hypothetical protein [Yersinia enterocolitica]
MRDDAVSFGLPEGETGNILAMINFGDTMEVYTEKSTFKMMSPDTIDPERNHHDTPWVYTKISDFGASNPLVANTLLLANDFLKQLFSEKDSKYLEIIKKVSDIRNVLLECLLSLQSYSEELKKEIEKFESNKKSMNGKAHAYFPQIKNIDGFTTSFLIAAKRCIQEISVLVNMYIPLKVKHGRIDLLLKEVESDHAHAKDLIEVLRTHLSMCAHIFSLRNAQEHAATRDNPLIVKNFSIENGLELSFPKWGIKGSPPALIHVEANDILAFLITFFEEIFLTCTTLIFPIFPVYNIFINDKPDDKMPIRYSLQLSLPDNFPIKGI